VIEGINVERVEGMISTDQRFADYYVFSQNRSLLDVGDSVVAHQKDPQAALLAPPAGLTEDVRSRSGDTRFCRQQGPQAVRGAESREEAAHPQFDSAAALCGRQAPRIARCAALGIFWRMPSTSCKGGRDEFKCGKTTRVSHIPMIRCVNLFGGSVPRGW
jgi:hypothetical protein